MLAIQDFDLPKLYSNIEPSMVDRVKPLAVELLR